MEKRYSNVLHICNIAKGSKGRVCNSRTHFPKKANAVNEKKYTTTMKMNIQKKFILQSGFSTFIAIKKLTRK